MPLVHIVIALVVIGLILWAINTYIPMDEKIKGLLNIVVLIVVLLWCLQALGLLPAVSDVRVR